MNRPAKRYVPFVVGLAAFLLYAATVCPTVPFGDGGELIAASACLGVAHPPGYPLYTLLGWLALQAPFGEPALRMNLLSSVFGAATCAALAGWVLRVTGSAVGATAAALSLAASSTFWWVAVNAEVYTLHLLLCTLLLSGAAMLGSAASPRAAAGAALLASVALGLGLAHHPTIVLVLPAALLLALRGGRTWLPLLRVRWAIAAVVLALGMPALLYLTMMWRARVAPPSNWGHPTTLATLVPHVTAASFRHLDLGFSALVRAAGWRRLGGLVLTEFTPAILPLALLGLAAPTQLRATLAALIAAGALFGLRYVTEDVEVFFLPLWLGLAASAGVGIAVLARHPRRAVRVAGLVAAVLVVLMPVAAHASTRALRDVTAAADYGRDVLQTIPHGGLLFVESDEAFVLLYLKQVLNERPNVNVYSRKGVLFRSVVDELALPQRAGEPWRSYSLRAEQVFLQRVLAVPRHREIFFLGWPGYDLPPQLRLEPVGLLNRLCLRTDPVRDDRTLWGAYHEQRVLEQARRMDHDFAIAVAALYPIARGERALFAGDRARAYAAFTEAAELASATPGVHSYLGTIYGRSGDYARAIAAFERAVAIQPTAVEAWNNLGMAHELSGDRSLAVAAWRRSLELVPGQEDVRASIARLERAE